MMKPFRLKAILIVPLLTVNCFIHGQARPFLNSPEETNAEATVKPYKILTNGKQVTIQSKQDIRSVMVWTSNGNRIVEQKDINAASYKFTVTVKEKIFFMMLETVDGKRFTEKIGVQQ